MQTHSEQSPETPQRRSGPSLLVRALAVFLMAVILPLAVIGVMEITLRLIGYGLSGNLLVESGIPDKLTLGHDYHLFFQSGVKQPETPRYGRMKPFLMQHPKPDGVYRIFVIGGSAAQGYPYHQKHSLGDIAGVLLDNLTEEKEVEVLNLSNTAQSSYYVRETVRRLWRYQPDMLVIYSGHNEYYGTIGAGSGRGHRRKLLYLRLKKSRVFQWMLGLTASRTGDNALSSPNEIKTVMAERMADTVFMPDPEFDETVAERYIDNIESVVRNAMRRDIPIIIMQPTCNLISMPPFDGKHAAELSGLIERGKHVISGSENDITAWRNSLEHEPLATENAHLLYLKALADLRDGKEAIDGFRAARDADIIPFRARSTLANRLTEWAADHPENIRYIPLQQKMIEHGGIKSLSDTYFLDHLHFNHDGHMLAARILARNIAEIAGWDAQSKVDFLPSDEEIRELISYHPAIEVHALRGMEILIDYPPFSDMIIPYKGEALSTAIRENPLLQDEELSDIVAGINRPENLFNPLFDYLIENASEEVIPFARALVYSNPGNYTTHWNLASLLSFLDIKNPEVFELYINAYMLSGFREEVRNDMETYAIESGYEEQLNYFTEHVEPFLR